MYGMKDSAQIQLVAFSSCNVRNLSLHITNLEKYTAYVIRVAAITVKGRGNESDPLVVMTDEGGNIPFVELETTKQLR